MRLGVGVVLADDRLIYAKCFVKFSLTAEVVAAGFTALILFG